METGLAYIAIIDVDYDILVHTKKLIAQKYHPEDMCILGNELLIPVPEKGGLGFSLNELRELVAPCRVTMFNLEDENGLSVRYWYE